MTVSVRKVLNGKVYDTDTAELVHVCVNNTRGLRDCKTEWTGLYKSPKGQWFLAGEGGLDTRWRRKALDGKLFIGGQGVTLVTPTEARELLEKFDGDVESHFEVQEG